MKQIFTLALTFLLIFSLVTVTAFAETSKISATGGTATKAVTASYSAGAGGGTVYSVDITWDSMAFTYSEGPSPTWNPETHTSGQGGTGGWSSSGNKVTVTNHSNTEVTATLAYASTEGFKGISGSFDKSTMNLVTAVGTTFENAPKDTAALTLDGTLDSSVKKPTQIGTITVTIN